MPPGASTATSTEERARLLQRGLRLEFATLGWNALEAVLLGAAAVEARSVAMAGFALDSLIEIFASLVVVGQLRGRGDEASEAQALRRIGLAFFGLALYIAVQGGVTVALGVRPESSPIGIAWLSLTVVAMLGLAAAKARTGRRLDHAVLTAESRVTMIDGTLAAAILAGLLLNALLGWWWADVAAGGVLVAYGVREGRESVRAGR